MGWETEPEAHRNPVVVCDHPVVVGLYVVFTYRNSLHHITDLEVLVYKASFDSTGQKTAFSLIVSFNCPPHMCLCCVCVFACKWVARTCASMCTWLPELSSSLAPQLIRSFAGPRNRSLRESCGFLGLLWGLQSHTPQAACFCMGSGDPAVLVLALAPLTAVLKNTSRLCPLVNNNWTLHTFIG